MIIGIIRRKKPFIYWCILSIFEKLDRQSHKLCIRHTRQKLDSGKRRPSTTNKGKRTANRDKDRTGGYQHTYSNSRLIENWGRCCYIWLYFQTNRCISVWLPCLLILYSRVHGNRIFSITSATIGIVWTYWWRARLVCRHTRGKNWSGNRRRFVATRLY